MNWEQSTKGFKNFLKIEKALANNTIEAYLRDLNRFKEFSIDQLKHQSPLTIQLSDIRSFIKFLNDLGLSTRSQARHVSSIKVFYQFLMIEDLMHENPTELLEAPKLGTKLPEVLSVEEINEIIAQIDLSKPEGIRNKAIIETLYSCGLRVSELVELRISNLFFSEGFIRVIGKGNKERLVPVGQKAIQEINLYLDNVRNHQEIKPGHENILFLNRRGRKLTRVMIFTVIKSLKQVAGIEKKVSPHTFRHSFATHLIEGGADLRAVQEMLGHESIITTEIYTHIDRQYLKDTILQHHPRA
ncbi:MAG: site-specific tyrosine recombinase XerD [Bacteroidetes bacterium]|jgi:integrase/recombinase XerD|nr:site-specific tyrosine recombinase XerD [Bacteroidota bacterium]